MRVGDFDDYNTGAACSAIASAVTNSCATAATTCVYRSSRGLTLRTAALASTTSAACAASAKIN